MDGRRLGIGQQPDTGALTALKAGKPEAVENDTDIGVDGEAACRVGADDTGPIAVVVAAEGAGQVDLAAINHLVAQLGIGGAVLPQIGHHMLPDVIERLVTGKDRLVDVRIAVINRLVH